MDNADTAARIFIASLKENCVTCFPTRSNALFVTHVGTNGNVVISLVEFGNLLGKSSEGCMRITSAMGGIPASKMMLARCISDFTTSERLSGFMVRKEHELDEACGTFNWKVDVIFHISNAQEKSIKAYNALMEDIDSFYNVVMKTPQK